MAIEKTKEELKEELKEFPAQIMPEENELAEQMVKHTHEGTGTSMISSRSVRRKLKSGCSVYRGSSQTISSGSDVKVQFDTEDYDLSNEFDSSTNYEFKAKQDGYYQVNASVEFQLSAASDIRIHLYKNGSDYKLVKLRRDTVGSSSVHISTFIKLEKDDYIDIRVDHVTGSDETINSGSTITWLQIYKTY